MTRTIPEPDTPDAVTVASRLRPVLLKLNRELRREIHALGVTGGQAALLAVLKGHPGIGVRELAALEGLSAPAMSGYVDRLEAAGLVRRARSESDRRRVGIELTPAGLRVLRSVRSRRTAWLARRLAGLDERERAAISAAIAPLERLIGDDA